LLSVGSQVKVLIKNWKELLESKQSNSSFVRIQLVEGFRHPSIFYLFDTSEIVGEIVLEAYTLAVMLGVVDVVVTIVVVVATVGVNAVLKQVVELVVVS